MSEEKLYELKRDINTPAMYIRAGKRGTEQQWRSRLGQFHMKWASDWFIDIEREQPGEVDELKALVDAVFERKGLASLTYKDAAREIAELWLKQNK